MVQMDFLTANQMRNVGLCKSVKNAKAHHAEIFAIAQLSCFTGQMPFLLHNQQHQSTEGSNSALEMHKMNNCFQSNQQMVVYTDIQEAQLTLWVADRTAPSHTRTITRYVFERSMRSVDKRSSYLRELVWQPSWQLDNWLIGLNCASVYKL